MSRLSNGLLLSATALFIVLTALPVQSAPLDDPTALIRKIETQYQGDRSRAIGIMRIKTAAWSRELRMEMWGEGRNRFLTRILAPKKERGIATLKVDDNIWNYLPRIDKLIKVPSGLMGEGWMGSHFTNDDLVKESKIDELYSFSVLFSGESTAVILATPHPEAAVVWGGIHYQVDHLRDLPLLVDYFDEDGEHMRRITFSDVRNVGGRTVPMAIRIVPSDQPGEYTEMLYESLDFNVTHEPGLFTTRGLRR